MFNPVYSLRAGLLEVCVFESREAAGRAAAGALAYEIRRLITDAGRAIGVFGWMRSEGEFWDRLVSSDAIEWIRTIGFQLDEYLGLAEDSPASAGKYLIDRLVTKVPMAEFHRIRGEAANPEAVCANYSALLRSRPPDFAVLEVGETGGIGFNLPMVGDFNDEARVRIVDPDEDFRNQQVSDGLFSSIESVPRRAITLTIPMIMSCPRLLVIASGEKKREAVRDVISGKVSTECPASILRSHKNATLFLDREAAKDVR
jgi:glucosamine-6-phosphate deaminase